MIRILFLLFLLPGIAFSRDGGQLSAFAAYTDLRLGSIERTLEVVASTWAAKSGKWNEARSLLEEYERSEKGIVLWYMLPDGTYYTVDKGRMGMKLSDRDYFPDLASGRKVIGALVVSKSTGRRSAVIAVPVERAGKTVGAVGASVFLDTLAERIGEMLSLDKGASFFALVPDGRTALHSKTDRHFLDPRELGSETLKKAAEEMLARDSGEVSYVYDNASKHAVFTTSKLTGWKYAITR